MTRAPRSGLLPIAHPLALLLALCLSACGIKGDLRRPGAAPAPVADAQAPAATPADPDTNLIDPEEQDDDPGPFYGPDFESDFGEDDD